MLRKVSSLFILACLGITLAAGCGGDEEKEQEPLQPGAKCDPDGDRKNGGCGSDAECVAPEALGAGGGSGSGDSICLVKEGNECDPDEAFCSNGLTCAETTSGEHRCWGAVVLRGDVTDTSDGAAIADAHVIAIDDEGVAATDVAISDAEGNYLLSLPVLRNDDGTPAEGTFTLSASAQDYQPFPRGARVALPIDVSEAMADGSGYVIESALTDIGLIPLPAGDRQSISGSIAGLEGDEGGEIGGVLVVATGSEGTFSAITDSSGNYTIFNVPAGDYEIQAYAAGIQVEGVSVAVADEPAVEVELAELAEGTTTVTGNIQIVNAPGDAVTSVILVVEDTFDADAARGEAPRGLRAPASGPPDVDGDFVIEGVPAGRYVVLAAYENDDLVRDPDQNIAGTDFVTIEVMGEVTLDLSESFKVTEALATVSPGAEAPEAVSEKPDLVWADDSSEEWYEVRVFDAFGEEVWNDLMVVAESGSANVTRTYEGPLEPGMYYQFRVTSWRQPGGGEASPISATEDLRGVFYAPAP